MEDCILKQFDKLEFREVKGMLEIRYVQLEAINE